MFAAVCESGLYSPGWPYGVAIGFMMLTMGLMFAGLAAIHLVEDYYKAKSVSGKLVFSAVISFILGFIMFIVAGAVAECVESALIV